MNKNPHNLIERKSYWFRYESNDWFKARVTRIDDSGHVWLKCTDPVWKGIWTKDFAISLTDPT